MRLNKLAITLHLEETFFFLLSCAAFLWIAISNGYPTFYPDSGTYMLAGFNSPPIDRPYWYCLFVRHISMWYSLWFVVLAQAILLTVEIAIFLKYVLGTKKVMRKTFFVAAVASFTTGVSFYTSQIMPDIFAAMSILSIAILFSGKTPIKVTVFLLVIMLFSAMAHSSVLLINTMIVTAAFIFCSIFRKFFAGYLKKFQVRSLILITFLTWLIIPILNYSVGAGFNITRSGNVFLVKRLSDSGIMKNYLNDKCEHGGSPFCKYKKGFDEVDNNFLWNEQGSPLYDTTCMKNGWSTCWIEKNQEFAPLVSDVLSTPKYLLSFIRFSANESCHQLLDIQIEDLNPMLDGSPIKWPMMDKFKREYDQYANAKQQTVGGGFPVLDRIQKITVVLLLLIILCLLIIKKTRERLSNKAKAFVLLVFFGFLFNAIICATFSQVGGRFQSRVIWLLILIATLIIAELIPSKKRSVVADDTEKN